MTVKGYLGQIRLLSIRIDQRMAELDDLRSIAGGLTGLSYDRDNVQTSASNNQMINAMVKLEELELEINNLIEYYISEQNKIIDQIQGIEDHRYMQILFKRYIQFKGLKVIAQEMDYDETYIRELQNDSLKAFYEKYKNILHNLTL